MENDAELKLKVDEIAYSVMKREADEPAYLPRAYSTLTDKLKSLCLLKKFISFRNGLKKHSKYLSNMLDMIGTMMLLKRATKQKLSGLHLASLDRFSPYFYTPDSGNFAQITPVYLSSMYSIRKDYQETWISLLGRRMTKLTSIV